jgi:DNA-binding CsgD family transcriptional regulator
MTDITIKSTSKQPPHGDTSFDAGDTRITATERITAGYTCKDYKTNTEMANELKITPV